MDLKSFRILNHARRLIISVTIYFIILLEMKRWDVFCIYQILVDFI